jgi:hypothetical protein
MSELLSYVKQRISCNDKHHANNHVQYVYVHIYRVRVFVSYKASILHHYLR